MAIDPNAPILPQDQQIIDPGYSYKDLHEQPLRDIVEGKPVIETPEVKPEEKPVETKPEVEVPLDDVIQKTAREAAQAIIDEENTRKSKLEADRLAEEEKNKPQPKPNEEYQKIVDDFKEREGRTPTWDELAVKIEERSIQKLKDFQENERKTATETAKKVEDAKAQELSQLNAHIDDELNDLYNAGKLTKIKDINNPSDQGVVERKALFQTWQDVNTKRKSEGKPEIISATRIYEFYYKKPDAQPPGVAAPIAGNKTSTVNPTDEKSYTYQDIHKTPWNFFNRKK